MTIKEMQKVFKKVHKARVQMADARYELSKLNVSAVVHIAEMAKLVAKNANTINKIAIAMNVAPVVLIDNAGNEEDFLRWCLVNNIEMTSASDEEEEAEESEA